MNKKQTRTVFLFKFQLDRKPAETARDISHATGPGTVHEPTTNWYELWSKLVRLRIRKLKNSKILENWVPHELSDNQKKTQF